MSLQNRNHATLLFMKQSLRELMLQKRLALSPVQRATYSRSLIHQVIALPQVQNASTIGLFHPIKNEPDLLEIVSLLPQKHFLLPVVHGTTMTFHTYFYHNQTFPLIQSELHILEPKTAPLFQGPIDVLITPALALDQAGHRLGFGKGYFDQYIQTNRPRLIIGVIYPFQWVDTLPVDDHDENVDLVLIANEDSTHQ
jgi:5-formyltetrahydrofolate cyclo-ligase